MIAHWSRIATVMVLLFAPAPVRAAAKPKGGTDAKEKGAPAKPATTPAATTAAPATAPQPAAGAAKAPAPAKAATYEEAREGAGDPGPLEHFLEPLFAECNQARDIDRRRCQQIRTWHLSRIHGQKWVAVADGAALFAQPYDGASQALPLVVTGCLSCTSPPVVAGSPRLLVTKPPKSFDGESPVGIDVSYHEVAQPTAAKAAAFTSKMKSRLRVEFVFTVGEPFPAAPQPGAPPAPAPPPSAPPPQKGVQVVAVAHRVYDQCTGDVIASEPPSKGPVTIAVRDPSCPPPGALTDEEEAVAKEQATLPDSLSRSDISKAMEPVQERIYECGQEFELRGIARVKITVPGDGKNTKLSVSPPYDKGDAYLCIRAAFKEAKFPRFKTSSPPVIVDYPFVLRR